MRIQCFACPSTFENPQELFVHVKDVHDKCGKSRYVCSCLCIEVFSQFGAYQKHVNRCFAKMAGSDGTAAAELLAAYNDVAMENEEVLNFRKSISKRAFEITCKLNAIMMLPRSLVYRTIQDFETLIQMVVDGMSEIVMPRVLGPEKQTMKEFMSATSACFSKFKTESTFERKLIEAEIIFPFDRCLMTAADRDEPNVDMDMDLECAQDKTEKPVLMPLSFQIQKFLELPGVLKTMLENAANIKRNGKLNHFINGSLWKKKMMNFNENQIVIPYHYYSDGAQLNHPLGPHIRNGSEDFQYYSFPTIPFQFQSRWDNIFVAYLFPEKFYSQFSLEEIFNNLIEKLTELATDGVVVNVDSVQYQVFLVCGSFLADNKEANVVLSFAKGHNAKKYCRFCNMDMAQMKTTTTEIPKYRRNRENYEEDINYNDLNSSRYVTPVSLTGILEYSVFNKIPYFHITESSSEDVTHTVEEGIMKYNITGALARLIYQEKEITLENLNHRIKEFVFSVEEKSNKPKLLMKENLDSSKLKMTAAETANFVQNLPFMIGDCISEDSPAWQLILKTVRFFDLSYLPCYNENENENDIEEWRKNIDEMHTSYMDVCNTHLKPVHHYATHFPSDTLKFGPLRYLKTIRYEAKHRELKSYAKNSNNRIDLSYSIAKKVQYNFAERLLNSRGFENIIQATFLPGMIKDKVYYTKLQTSLQKERLVQEKCLFTNKINVNGMQINTFMWIPDVSDDSNRMINNIRQIWDIVVLKPDDINDIFLICKIYNATSNEHFAGYEIDMKSLHREFTIVNLTDFLETHHYPVIAHTIGSKVMFRCKRF